MGTSPKRLGKYELLTRLGQGGMAEVWKGFDPQLQRMVAIKFLHANLRSDPDFMSRFEREGQAIAGLHHPNIVQVYDFQVSSPDDENPMAYMVMDYIEGQTLAGYLQQTSYAGNIPAADEIVRLFTSLGLAVDYAHLHRMIHRDIKPANILLDARNMVHNMMGEPVLTDFGIVKMLGAAAITSTGISMGTPLYISPEQVHGQAGNEKSDIYALGVILYEICTGEPPYRGDNPYVILAQRVSGPPDAPSKRNPHISPEVDAVILRCLAMDPNDRFPSASLLTASLAEAFNISIPDLIRHVLLSSQRVSTSLSLSHPVLPIIENPAVALELLKGRNSDASMMGDDTILSDTGAMVAMASEVNASGIGNATILSDTGATRGAVSESKSLKREDAILSDTGATGVEESESKAPKAMILSDTGATKGAVSEKLPQSDVKIATLEDQLAATSVMLPEPSQSSTPTLPVVPVRRSTTLMLTRPSKSWLIPICSILLVLLLIVGGISTYMVLNNKPALLPVGAASIGNITFLSSDLLNPQNVPSVNDGIQIHLYHVPTPLSGQRYYAWAQDPTNTANAIFLGALQDQHGDATLSYVDSQHRNLLASMSSFLVTEQSASHVSALPDRGQWRYAAMIPQTPSSTDHRSYLDHLRHLLVSDPMLERLQLHYGIDFWLLNSIEELYKDLTAVSDDNNPQQVRQVLVNLLYILDGSCAQQELRNTPGSKLSVDSTIAQASRISLLDCGQEMRFSGSLAAATHNLNRMASAPGVSVQEARRVVQVKSDLNTLRSWLEQVRVDVLQLVHMDDAHLKQAQVTRNDLVIQASNMISGRFDQLTQTLQPSVKQISNEITFLAHVDVSPYKAV